VADNQGDDTVFISSEAPEPIGKQPSHTEKPRNLAGDDELCAKYRSWAYNRVNHYDTQDARDKFMRTAGTMDKADRMYRISLRRMTDNTQNENTRSDVTSTSYFRSLRAVTAGENMIYFNGQDMPAEYVPEVDTDEYTIDQGRIIADQQNMLEQFTFDEDKRTMKVKDLVRTTNKYANSMASIKWQRTTRKVKERVPKRDGEGNAILNENGTIKEFTRKMVDRVVADWPVLATHDMKDCFFDAQIDDMEKQELYAIRCKRNISELRLEQANGHYMNVEKIGTSQLYTGDDSTSNDPLEDRMTNAGEGATLDRDGTIQVWEVYGNVPIKENKSKRKPGGKWDTGIPAENYWAVYAGDLNSSAVCLQLIKNPNHSGHIPHKLLHSHWDDKGAYHDGFPTMLESLYEQATVNRNQAFDNITLLSQAPWILDGPCHTRDLKFRANKVVKVGRGVQFKQADVRDASQATGSMADLVEGDIEKTTGADKPIVGEALGSRTSATEAKQVLDQATLPLEDKASYFSDQLFTWMLEMDAEQWRQYGNPQTVRRITRSNSIVELIPAELWGPVRTKVTALNRFKTNVQQRQDFNAFMQNVFPQVKDYMGQKGATEFLRDGFHMFGWDRSEEYFPQGLNPEARQAAKQAAWLMANTGEFVEPQLGENHAVWVNVLETIIDEMKLLPDVEPERLQILQQHIVRRKAMMQEEVQGAQQGQQQPRGLPGEIAGNAIEAQEGALA
jgi:hypothetical protein